MFSAKALFFFRDRRLLLFIFCLDVLMINSTMAELETAGHEPDWLVLELPVVPMCLFVIKTEFLAGQTGQREEKEGNIGERHGGQRGKDGKNKEHRP